MTPIQKRHCPEDKSGESHEKSIQMLRTLSIHDFVIVDAIELELTPGFTVFTGETGAGKSILIDALALALGGLTYGVKPLEMAAAFAAFTRVFLSALEPFSADWAPVVWLLAAATMILGTVVGVAQTNLKRMLAY